MRFPTGAKRRVPRLYRQGDWADAGKGFEGAEPRLKLTGWSQERRVIVLRRPLAGEVALADEGPVQLHLAFIDGPATMRRYEYAVLVTSLPSEILTLAQLYRDRADCENCFDELKNQWGWGGYTTKDLKRCRLTSRLVALVYNWWNLFVRLAQPKKHAEAITSRPLLLHGVARQTRHAGQTTLTITSSHARSQTVQSALRALTRFLNLLQNAAEQLRSLDRLGLITQQAFRYLLDKRAAIAGLLPPPIVAIIG